MGQKWVQISYDLKTPKSDEIRLHFQTFTPFNTCLVEINTKNYNLKLHELSQKVSIDSYATVTIGKAIILQQKAQRP